MDQIKNLITSLSSCYDISGLEKSALMNLEPFLSISGFEKKTDLVGNILFTKLSGKKNAKRILIEAHLDTIGFCVKEITKDGFISACPCGGIDADILPGTEVTTTGDEKRIGIACSLPPHLTKTENSGKDQVNEIYFDFGFSSRTEAKKHMDIGDGIAFSHPLSFLNENKITGPGLDNKAAIISLLLAMEKVASDHDLFFLFSVGEETTSKGVISIAEEVNPDIAIVVDAGFAFAPGLEESGCIQMNQGPSVSITDTLTRALSDWVIDCAKKQSLPLQIVCEPGGTGTSATKLQLENGSIPCVVISIPLKNMHTPSEIASVIDIKATADLICCLVSEKEIPSQEVILIAKK